jgi:hypothetical protein
MYDSHNQFDHRVEQTHINHNAEKQDGERQHGGHGAIALTPLSIIGPISEPNPPNSAKIIGTMISAVSTDMRLVMIKAMKTMIIEKARIVNR